MVTAPCRQLPISVTAVTTMSPVDGVRADRCRRPECQRQLSVVGQHHERVWLTWNDDSPSC